VKALVIRVHLNPKQILEHNVESVASFAIQFPHLQKLPWVQSWGIHPDGRVRTLRWKSQASAGIHSLPPLHSQGCNTEIDVTGNRTIHLVLQVVEALTQKTILEASTVEGFPDCCSECRNNIIQAAYVIKYKSDPGMTLLERKQHRLST